MVDHPSAVDLYTMGTVGHIRHIMRLPDQSARLMVEGVERALLVQLLDEGDVQTAQIVVLSDASDAGHPSTGARSCARPVRSPGRSSRGAARRLRS